MTSPAISTPSTAANSTSPTLPTSPGSIERSAKPASEPAVSAGRPTTPPNASPDSPALLPRITAEELALLGAHVVEFKRVSATEFAFLYKHDGRLCILRGPHIPAIASQLRHALTSGMTQPVGMLEGPRYCLTEAGRALLDATQPKVVRSIEEIRDQHHKAGELSMSGSRSREPHLKFEDGVWSALEWLLCADAVSPIAEEE